MNEGIQEAQLKGWFLNILQKGLTFKKKFPYANYWFTRRMGDTLLHYAVRYAKGRIVEHLVDEPTILISRKGGSLYGTALEEAIYYGHLDIASYLIDRGTYLNIRDYPWRYTTPHSATKRGYLNIVEKLIANGHLRVYP